MLDSHRHTFRSNSIVIFPISAPQLCVDFQTPEIEYFELVSNAVTLLLTIDRPLIINDEIL